MDNNALIAFHLKLIIKLFNFFFLLIVFIFMTLMLSFFLEGNLYTGECICVFCQSIIFLVFSDKNECEAGSHNCEQICVNSLGSFSCACNPGYVLGSNGRSCSRKCIAFLSHFNSIQLNIIGTALKYILVLEIPLM